MLSCCSPPFPLSPLLPWTTVSLPATFVDSPLRRRSGAALLQMGSHNLNKTSTRSHCIMTLQVKARSRDEDGKLGPTRHGRISLVDLAGERSCTGAPLDGADALAPWAWQVQNAMV